MQKELMQDLKSVKPSDYVRNNHSNRQGEAQKVAGENEATNKGKLSNIFAESKENCSSCGAGQLPGMGGINRGPGWWRSSW